MKIDDLISTRLTLDKPKQIYNDDHYSPAQFDHLWNYEILGVPNWKSPNINSKLEKKINKIEKF